MATSDMIADMLARINNAQKAKLMGITCQYSKIKESMLALMQKLGYIAGYEVYENEGKPILSVDLKYSKDGSPVIKELKRVSKPGKRIYQGYKEIKPFYNGFGNLLISTSKGVMVDKQVIENKLGGEVICKIF